MTPPPLVFHSLSLPMQTMKNFPQQPAPTAPTCLLAPPRRAAVRLRQPPSSPAATLAKVGWDRVGSYGNEMSGAARGATVKGRPEIDETLVSPQLEA
mmetsp:Transcript_9198/g.19514  ORF Transcript_9198/g.19514 Transcript_9198/m.19514 type:complete len:97 (+) Transcript_9198:83-373(+)